MGAQGLARLLKRPAAWSCSAPMVTTV